jgi:electron transfer flavoprotein alpha subunit
MIGQSEKMCNPDLYIGVGLSGELQHMVGIMGAKLMVAINNDPNSPVLSLFVAELLVSGISSLSRNGLPPHAIHQNRF